MSGFTLSPVPLWRELLSAFTPSPLPDEALAAPWCSGGDRVYWLSRSAWSLQVLATWRRCSGEGHRPPIIWLPDYFCNSALRPLRDAGATLAFYPVDDAMHPDSESCMRLAEGQPPDIFVLVHYFGRPIVAEWLPGFCESTGAWLVEDATHALKAMPGIGDQGMAVLFSPHKHLAIPDGALLVVREHSKCRSDSCADSIASLERVVATLVATPNRGSFRWPWLWLAKRFLQRLGVRRAAMQSAFSGGKEPPPPPLPHPCMSRMAKRMLGYQIGSLEAIAARRVRHRELWASALAHVLPGAKGGAIRGVPSVPYLAEICSDCADEAERFFLTLQDVGVAVMTWPDLPPEVMADPGAHAAAMRLRHRKCFLPIHQSLTTTEIEDAICRLLMSRISRWQVGDLSLEAWKALWGGCARASMVQAWEYGEARLFMDARWKPQRFVIQDDQGQPYALVQAFVRKLPFVGSLVRVNRGPLLLRGDIGNEGQRNGCPAALAAILREGRQRGWRVLRVAPELPDDDVVRSILSGLGMRRLDRPAWASARISLKSDEQRILMTFDGKWRNGLRKGQKLGVNVVCHPAGSNEMVTLLQQYESLQLKNGFRGLSGEFLSTLFSQPESDRWRLRVFFAYSGDDAEMSQAIGVLVSAVSGDTCNYLIGASNDEGRRMQANSVLLFAAILQAREDGCLWFDVGGLSEETPKGIADFKRGLNAVPYRNVGEYLWIRGWR